MKKNLVPIIVTLVAIGLLWKYHVDTTKKRNIEQLKKNEVEDNNGGSHPSISTPPILPENTSQVVWS